MGSYLFACIGYGVHSYSEIALSGQTAVSALYVFSVPQNPFVQVNSTYTSFCVWDFRTCVLVYIPMNVGQAIDACDLRMFVTATSLCGGFINIGRERTHFVSLLVWEGIFDLLTDYVLFIC